MKQKKQSNKIKNTQGFSLVETLVVVGIMAIVSLALSNMISHQNKQIKVLSSKLQIKDLETSLKTNFSNSDYCGCLFRSISFNETTKSFNQSIASIPIAYSNVPTSLSTPCTPNTTGILVPAINHKIEGSDLTISEISVENITEIVPSSGFYTGQLNIKFDISDLGALKGSSINLSFKIDKTTGAPTTRTLLTCNSAASNLNNATTIAPKNVGTWSIVTMDSSLESCPPGTILGNYCFPSGGSCNAMYSPVTFVAPSLHTFSCSGSAAPYVPTGSDGGGGI